MLNEPFNSRLRFLQLELENQIVYYPWFHLVIHTSEKFEFTVTYPILLKIFLWTPYNYTRTEKKFFDWDAIFKRVTAPQSCDFNILYTIRTIQYNVL